MQCAKTLLALMLVLLAAGVTQGAPNEAIKRNNFGADLVKQGRLEEAVSEFRLAVQAEPRYTPAQLNLAYTYERLGRDHEAIAAYKKVIELDPRHVTALNNLGVLYTKKEMYAEAVQTLEQGLAADPSDAALKKNLATAQKNRELFHEREGRITEATRQAGARPQDPRAAYDVVRVYASFDMQDQAFEWLEKALQLGLDDMAFVREDPVLLGLRRDPRFARLLEGR